MNWFSGGALAVHNFAPEASSKTCITCRLALKRAASRKSRVTANCEPGRWLPCAAGYTASRRPPGNSHNARVSALSSPLTAVTNWLPSSDKASPVHSPGSGISSKTCCRSRSHNQTRGCWSGVWKFAIPAYASHGRVAQNAALNMEPVGAS